MRWSKKWCMRGEGGSRFRLNNGLQDLFVNQPVFQSVRELEIGDGFAWLLLLERPT